MVQSAADNAGPGDIVSVYDRAGQIFGHAIYNPRSQIALRVLRHGPQPIDDAFWRGRIAAAVALRRDALKLDRVCDAYRLVHSEGDGLSGLIAERFADHIVIEVFSLGVFRRIDVLKEMLAEALGPAPSARDEQGEWKFVVRADQRTQQLEGFRLPAPSEVDGRRLIIREHGIRFRIDPRAGHKTGFFCDQRDNRLAFASLCEDATVLDLCCNSGGFGLLAKCRGKAREVVALDLDEVALELAKENANLNQARIQHVHADAFVYLRQMIANGRRFDAVVLDPPKLIATRDDMREGRQRYLDLNKLALQAVRPGGLLLTCSCSGLLSRDDFLDMIRQATHITHRAANVFDITGAAGDHPIALDCPETSYLKAAWLRVGS